MSMNSLNSLSSRLLPPEAQVLQNYLLVMAYRLKNKPRSERGAVDLAVVVIMTAIVAAATIAIGYILVTKFTDKANSTPTE